MTLSNPRIMAAHAVVSVQKGVSLSEIIASKKNKMTPQSSALFQQIAYGVIRHYFSLTTVQKKLLSKALKKKEALVNALILTGLYQLIYLNTPVYATINETVEAAKILKKKWAVSLINAVLRNFQRNRSTLLAPSSLEEQYDHPLWLIQQYQTWWPKDYKSILQTNNTKPPLTLRVNTKYISRSNYLSFLDQAHLAGKATQISEVGITLSHPIHIEKIPFFSKGWVSVQDESAQHAAFLLDSQPYERVLDACAAPGGKTGHILEYTDPIELWSLDISNKRLQLIQENMTRIGEKTKLLCGDARAPSTWWDGQPFDRILADVPCSATGVIRRHPDIKILRSKADIKTLLALQYEILQALWALLKPGGMLLYATCSVFPEENDAQVKTFITQHEDACLGDTPERYRSYCTDYGIQFLPHKDRHDGFFYSRIVKNKRVMEKK